MARDFRRTSTLGRSVRRATDWFSGPRGVLTFSAVANQAFGTGITNFVDGQTLIRTRGDVIVGLSSTGGALEGFGRVGLGICVVTDKAATIGITAIPAPITEMGWDGWLWHWVGAFKSIEGVSPTTDANGQSAMRIPIDSKAMRKLGEDQTIVAVMEARDEVGTSVLDATLNTRMLMKRN